MRRDLIIKSSKVSSRRLHPFLSPPNSHSHVYSMGVSWHACMSADTLGVHIYYLAIGWHACSRGTYMSADMLGAHIIYLGQYTICSLKIYLGRDWLVHYMHHFGTYKNMFLA